MVPKFKYVKFGVPKSKQGKRTNDPFLNPRNLDNEMILSKDYNNISLTLFKANFVLLIPQILFQLYLLLQIS